MMTRNFEVVCPRCGVSEAKARISSLGILLFDCPECSACSYYLSEEEQAELLRDIIFLTHNIKVDKKWLVNEIKKGRKELLTPSTQSIIRVKRFSVQPNLFDDLGEHLVRVVYDEFTVHCEEGRIFKSVMDYIRRLAYSPHEIKRLPPYVEKYATLFWNRSYLLKVPSDFLDVLKNVDVPYVTTRCPFCNQIPIAGTCNCPYSIILDEIYEAYVGDTSQDRKTGSGKDIPSLVAEIVLSRLKSEFGPYPAAHGKENCYFSTLERVLPNIKADLEKLAKFYEDQGKAEEAYEIRAIFEEICVSLWMDDNEENDDWLPPEYFHPPHPEPEYIPSDAEYADFEASLEINRRRRRKRRSKYFRRRI